MSFPSEKVTRLQAATLTVKHLMNNSTTHESPFSAIAELVDNAYDANAKKLHIDIRGDRLSERLEFLDDGCGMSREEALNVIKFGFSEKRGCHIGRYGNGLKSGGFYLGRDLLLLTKKNGIRTAVFISLSFLESQHCADTVYVPCPSMHQDGTPLYSLPNEYHRFNDEVDFIDQYERFNGGKLVTLFDKIPGEQGTLVIISKLHRSPIGELMININADPHDIKIDGDDLAEYKCSLRAYLQILYLHPKMAIYLRSPPEPYETFVHPTKILSGWMGRCYRDISASPFNDVRNDTIKKYKEEKKNLEQRKRGVITDNAETNQTRMHFKERKPMNNQYQRALDDINHEIELREQWIAEAQKQFKESTFRSYFGINVGNRGDYGIHFYINNRLILWGHKSAFFKKDHGVGISMYNELDFKTFSPTHNKQGFSSAKDFNLLVKQCDAYLATYHEWAEKIWLVNHLKGYNSSEENIWMKFWHKYGYTSSSKVPTFNEAQKLMIEKECGHWRVCRLCRKWKFLSSMDDVNYLEGPSDQKFFECTSIPGETCRNRTDMVSDKVVAMILPDRKKLEDRIKSNDRSNRALKFSENTTRHLQNALPKMASFRKVRPQSPSSPSSLSIQIISSPVTSGRKIEASMPSDEREMKEEDEIEDCEEVSSDVGVDFEDPTDPCTSSSFVTKPAREENRERKQRVHAAKPSEKVSRRRIHCSDDDDDDEDWREVGPPRKSKPSTSKTTSSRSVEPRAATKETAVPSHVRIRREEEKEAAALDAGLNVLFDHLERNQTHKLQIPSKGTGKEKLNSIITQIFKLKRK